MMTRGSLKLFDSGRSRCSLFQSGVGFTADLPPCSEQPVPPALALTRRMPRKGGSQ